MFEITRDAKKRLSGLEREAAEQFEELILHNRVYDGIREDDRLRHTLDVTERAYQLEECDDLPDEMELVPFGAAENLNDHVDKLVAMSVARECADLIENARGDWFDESDHYDQEDVEAAMAEASIWLADHHKVAETEGIDVDDVVWGDRDEAEEMTADA